MTELTLGAVVIAMLVGWAVGLAIFIIVLALWDGRKND